MQFKINESFSKLTETDFYFISAEILDAFGSIDIELKSDNKLNTEQTKELELIFQEKCFFQNLILMHENNVKISPTLYWIMKNSKFDDELNNLSEQQNSKLIHFLVSSVIDVINNMLESKSFRLFHPILKSNPNFISEFSDGYDRSIINLLFSPDNYAVKLNAFNQKKQFLLELSGKDQEETRSFIQKRNTQLIDGKSRLFFLKTELTNQESECINTIKLDTNKSKETILSLIEVPKKKSNSWQSIDHSYYYDILRETLKTINGFQDFKWLGSDFDYGAATINEFREGVLNFQIYQSKEGQKFLFYEQIFNSLRNIQIEGPTQNKFTKEVVNNILFDTDKLSMELQNQIQEIQNL